MLAGIVLFALLMVSACSAQGLQQSARPDTAQVRKELEGLYEQNTSAFLRHDVQAIMSLRAPDFHSITPDGKIQDRAAMETTSREF